MPDSPPHFISFINRDRVAALLFLLLCLYYRWQTENIMMIPGDEFEPFTARTVPKFLAYTGIMLSLLLLFSRSDKQQLSTPFCLHWPRFIGFVMLMLLYGWGLSYLGFILATSLFLMFGFYLLGERRSTVLWGASFPFVTAFYWLLTHGLGVYLESGLIFQP